MADLYSEYRDFLRRAAEVGLTRPTGLTPREHERLLHRSEILPRAEVTALRELIEDDVYGSGQAGSTRGRELIRGLMERMRSLPVVASEAEERVETDVVLGKSRLPRILPWALGIAVVALLLVAPKGIAKVGGGGSGGGGSRRSGSGGTRGGYVRGITPVDTSQERAAVRAARGDWSRPTADPTIRTVVVPEVQDESAVKGTFGFDTATGVDHEFLNWKEPFRPPLSLRHRTIVYDAIDSQFRFGVADQPLTALPAPTASQTRTFTADCMVTLAKGRPVPVPSPTPDAVAVSLRVTPPANVALMKDRADGLRAISDTSGEFRLVYELRSTNGYLSAALPTTPTRALTLSPMPLPKNVLKDAQTVLARVGQIPGADYEQTVRRLQAWCNGFVIAPIRRHERRENAFLTIALARKGCCRHRATTFVVLANAAGIPTRLVTNEIHAFAEVQFPNGKWRAVDFRLGEGRRGAWDFEPVLIGKYDVPKTVAVLLTCLMASVLITISAVRHRRSQQRPELTSEDRSTRTQRRTERDHGREEETVALLWLVDHARERLAEQFDLDFDDEKSLTIALHREGIDDLVRSQAVHLIRDAGHLDSGELSSLARRRELYWCVKNVLRWLDGRRTIDRTSI